MATRKIYYGTNELLPKYLLLNTVDALNEAFKELEIQLNLYTTNPLNLPDIYLPTNDIQYLMREVQAKKYKLIIDTELEYLREELGYMLPEEEKRVREMIDDILHDEYPTTSLPRVREIEHRIGRSVAKMIRDRESANRARSSSSSSSSSSGAAEEPPAKKSKEGDGLTFKRMLKYDIHSKRHSKV